MAVLERTGGARTTTNKAQSKIGGESVPCVGAMKWKC